MCRFFVLSITADEEGADEEEPREIVPKEWESGSEVLSDANVLDGELGADDELSR